MSEPVYGSAPYTATEKKIESAEAKSITGGGAESSNELSLEAPAENNPESDSMLDQLNEGKKQKLAPAIYSSFMHPRLQTGTLTFERKRISNLPTESKEKVAKNVLKTETVTKKPKLNSERSQHKFQFILFVGHEKTCRVLIRQIYQYFGFFLIVSEWPSG